MAEHAPPYAIPGRGQQAANHRPGVTQAETFAGVDRRAAWDAVDGARVTNRSSNARRTKPIRRGRRVRKGRS